jgi:hypothetical protein
VEASCASRVALFSSIHVTFSCTKKDRFDDETDFIHVTFSCTKEDRCDYETDFIHETPIYSLDRHDA